MAIAEYQKGSCPSRHAFAGSDAASGMYAITYELDVRSPGKIEFDRSFDSVGMSSAINDVESALRNAVPLTMHIYIEPDLFDPSHPESAGGPQAHG